MKVQNLPYKTKAEAAAFFAGRRVRETEESVKYLLQCIIRDARAFITYSNSWRLFV